MIQEPVLVLDQMFVESEDSFSNTAASLSVGADVHSSFERVPFSKDLNRESSRIQSEVPRPAAATKPFERTSDGNQSADFNENSKREQELQKRIDLIEKENDLIEKEKDLIEEEMQYMQFLYSQQMKTAKIPADSEPFRIGEDEEYDGNLDQTFNSARQEFEHESPPRPKADTSKKTEPQEVKHQDSRLDANASGAGRCCFL